MMRRSLVLLAVLLLTLMPVTALASGTRTGSTEPSVCLFPPHWC